MLNYLTLLPVKTRLTLGFGIILLLMLILTVLGIQKVNVIDHTLTEITDINSVKQRYAINYRGSVHDRAIAIRDVANARSTNEVQAFAREITELEAFYLESERKMQAMLSDTPESFSSQERSILANIDRIQARTLPIVNNIIQLKNNNQTEQINDLVLDQARPAFIDWLAAINQFIDYQEAANQKATPEARAVASGFQELMLALTAVSLVISLFVGYLIEKSMRRSLGGEPYEAAGELAKIAQGDLTSSVTSNDSNSLLGSLHAMQNKLTGIVANIVNAADQLSHQTLTVSSGSEQAYQAAQNQASLTADTAARLETMRDNIDQVSQTATRTEENSSSTASYAKQGREAINASAKEMELISETVNSTVEQIRRLEERTKEIGGIANVISGISEQTNLLALNAAIEAARAGESGRGFAVVADEVRQLAKRTGEATAEIENMIGQVQAETAASVSAMETTQPQVENGRALTLQATDLLENIEQQASDSLARIQELASAASDQVSSIGDIAHTMEQIAEMSENSINSLQANNSATNSLSELSDQLKSDVGFFKLN
ncbi:methyl-accepting chemotaxis protein [Thalassotalea euphylliae]|uniref:Methyl-accepting chemotaxis protein n=1 Tax=Thalassotalea euphylliae TaxID=1655234 RepID=A0A3E0UBF5_9GAMM|nr:methyl-accepting chemotaxis protein [Thalassotalea euphylliae]REL34331.1 methyl-accepting chemotaxis protein [Thalassotalea euphylliae]